MASLSLVHPEATLTVPAFQLMTKCTLFQKNPALLADPYRLRSTVPLSLLQQFLSAIEGNPIKPTSANFSGLSRLCEEFGFDALRSTLLEFNPSPGRESKSRVRTSSVAPPAVRPSPVNPPRSTPSLNSTIISSFPAIFDAFRGKQFKLLWRGSRDGFSALAFHRRCDGHTNTLTVILDTHGSIFGGFTPVSWESRVWNGKSENGDNSMKADNSVKILFSF
jgi:hypothetical protein